MNLIDVIDNSFNYKKLRKARIKRGYTVSQVAKETGVPRYTIEKLEKGVTKSISPSTLKTLCDFYGTDPVCYYGWTGLPIFSTFTGIVSAFMYGIPFQSDATFNVMSISFVLGMLGMTGAAKYFNTKKIKQEKEEKEKQKIEEIPDFYNLLYIQLSETEKETFEKFKSMSHLLLDSDKIFNPQELREEDAHLLAYFFAHKIKSEVKSNSELTPYTINEVETINTFVKNQLKINDNSTGGDL